MVTTTEIFRKKYIYILGVSEYKTWDKIELKLTMQFSASLWEVSFPSSCWVNLSE